MFALESFMERGHGSSTTTSSDLEPGPWSDRAARSQLVHEYSVTSVTTHTILPRVSQTTSVQVMDRGSRFLTHVPIANPPIEKTRSRHLTRSLSDRDFFPEALNAMVEKTEDSLCFELGSDEARTSEQTKSPRDGGPRETGPPQSAFDAYSTRAVARPTGAAVTSAAATRRRPPQVALVSCADADVRELVKMAESMPAKAKPLSSWETKPVLRKTLEVC